MKNTKKNRFTLVGFEKENNDISLNYAFPITLSKKDGDIFSKIKGIDELTVYEEPRWSFKDPINNLFMEYIKS